MSGHGAVGTSDYAYGRILELGGDATQQARRDVHVAIAHDQDAVVGLRNQISQVVRLSIRHSWVAGLDQVNPRPLRKLMAHFLHDRDGRIAKSVDRQQNFVVRIILEEEAAQILFQAIVLSAKRLQNTDWRKLR